MKKKESTLKRLLEFAEYYDIDIILIAILSVLLAIVISVPIIINKICRVFFAPLALILVYMIVMGILDLIDTYRWYFGLDKDKKQQ